MKDQHSYRPDQVKSLVQLHNAAADKYPNLPAAEDIKLPGEMEREALARIKKSFTKVLGTVLESKKFNVRNDFELYTELNEITKILNQFKDI